jgi:hypothetical protein
MKKITGITLLSLATLGLSAQGIDDLTRFSSRGLYGSPRFVATGGAFGALGNDFSAIHVNPAGAAVYRQNEAGATINFQTMSAESFYFGQRSMAEDFRTSLPSAGYVQVFSNPKSKTKYVFAITANRTDDFSGRQRIMSNNSNGSILQFWTETSNGIPLNFISDEAFLAYEAGLIWPVGPETAPDYVTDANLNGVSMQHLINRTGRASEVGITLAGLTQEKWHFGATLNITSFRFFEESTYSESFAMPTDVRLVNWLQDIDQSGSGVNLRLGGIYRVNQMVRLGLSATTPTLMRITEIYRTRVTGESIAGPLSPQGIEYISDYNVRTPADLTASAAFVIGKNGFISADYRIANMGSARFGRTSFPEGLDDVNMMAAEQLGIVNTLRIGGELRLDNFFVRGGYNYINSPFTANRRDGNINIYTGGVGYRTKSFEVNMALASSVLSQVYSAFPPVLPEHQLGSQTLTNTSFLIGMGFRF